MLNLVTLVNNWSNSYESCPARAIGVQYEQFAVFFPGLPVLATIQTWRYLLPNPFLRLRGAACNCSGSGGTSVFGLSDRKT